MSRLTLKQIELFRSQSEPLSTQPAGHVTSELFKSPSNLSKPASISLEQHFSEETRNFSGSELKKAGSKPLDIPMTLLGSGRPQKELYPWESMALKVCSPLGSAKHSSGIVNGHYTSNEPYQLGRNGKNMNLGRALDYAYAAGMQPLVRFLTEHMEMVHDPPYRNWGTMLTCGATSALEIVLRMFCNRGDAILAEQHTYPGLLEAAGLLGLQTVGIEMDDGGLVASDLESVLRNWDEAEQGRQRPFVLYMIPSGQNPTGTTQSLERKQAIYQVAEKYNLVIVEDDPYYFLRLACTSNSTPTPATDNTTTTFLSTLTPSYLSLDTSGRVIRLDSFSKILAPGLRAGWLTASDRVIDKFSRHTEVSTLAVSGPTQLLLWHLLEASWGHAGFLAWLQQLSHTYSSRLSSLIRACETHFPPGLCSWIPPRNGMFLWIRLDVERHPDWRKGEGERELARLVEGRIYDNCMLRGVQIMKGSIFDTREYGDGELIIRLTTAAAEEWEFEGALERVGEVLRAEFGIEEA